MEKKNKGEIIKFRQLNYKTIGIKIKGLTPLLQERDDGTCAEYYDKKKAELTLSCGIVFIFFVWGTIGLALYASYCL